MMLRIHVTGAAIIATAVAAIATLLVPAARAQTIKVDHTTVEVTGIPSGSLTAAQTLRMSFSHASVGGNLWGGLETLSTNSAFEYPRWTDNNRGNPGWEAKIADFEDWVAEHADEYDVFQNKFCYIDQDASFAAYRDSMVQLGADYPGKIVVWWTMPIMTSGADNALRQSFNQQVRDYCRTHDRPLFDLADIESHTVDGTAVTESGNEALDPDQSSDGGHLNDLGASRAAKAQWVLMAKLAGWGGSTAGAGGTGGTGGAITPTGGANSSGITGGTGSRTSGTSGSSGSGISKGGSSGSSIGKGGSSGSSSSGSSSKGGSSGVNAAGGGGKASAGGTPSAGSDTKGTSGQGGAMNIAGGSGTGTGNGSGSDSGCSITYPGAREGLGSSLVLMGLALLGRRSRRSRRSRRDHGTAR